MIQGINRCFLSLILERFLSLPPFSFFRDYISIFSEVQGFRVESLGVLFWGILGSIFVIPVKLIVLALSQIRICRIGAFCEHAYSVKHFHLEFFTCVTYFYFTNLLFNFSAGCSAQTLNASVAELGCPTRRYFGRERDQQFNLGWFASRDERRNKFALHE